MNTVDIPNFTNATTPPPLPLSSFSFCQSRTISFPPLPNLTYPAAPFILSATASSGLAVTFRTDTPGVCTVSGQTATIVAAESYARSRRIRGRQRELFEAPSMVGSFVVGKGTQTITFGPLSNMVSGAPPFLVSAVASSGLPVGFSSTTPTVCNVVGATVTLASAGTCSIVANQAGNTNYFAAPGVTQSFTFSPGVQPLTLNCERLRRACPERDRLFSGLQRHGRKNSVCICGGRGRAAGADARSEYGRGCGNAWRGRRLQLFDSSAGCGESTAIGQPELPREDRRRSRCRLRS